MPFLINDFAASVPVIFILAAAPVVVTVQGTTGSAGQAVSFRARGSDDRTGWALETSQDPGTERLRAGGDVRAGGVWVVGTQSFLSPVRGSGWDSALGTRTRRRDPDAGTATGDRGVSWAGGGRSWRGLAAWGRTEAGAPRGRLEIVRGPVAVGLRRTAHGSGAGAEWSGRSAGIPWVLEGVAGAARAARAAVGGGPAPLGLLLESGAGREGWTVRGGARFARDACHGTLELSAESGERARPLVADAAVAARLAPWNGRVDIHAAPGVRRARGEISVATGRCRWEIGAEPGEDPSVDLSGAGRGWRVRIRMPGRSATRLDASVVHRWRFGTVRLFAERTEDARFGVEWVGGVPPVDFAAEHGNDPGIGRGGGSG